MNNQPEIKQIIELIESSEEALGYLYHTRDKDEKEAMRGMLKDAVLAVCGLLGRYDLGEGLRHEEFILSLNEEPPVRAAELLGEIKSYVSGLTEEKIATALRGLRKTEILAAYSLLDALYSGDLKNAETAARALHEWYDAHPGESDSKAYQELRAKLGKIVAGPPASLREYNAMRGSLASVLSAGIDAAGVELHRSAAGLKNDGVINVLLAEGRAAAGQADKMDIIVSNADIMNRAYFCFPMDAFDYDRLYLSGKLQSLKETRKNVSIAIAGSSYAMVGLKEGLMPKPAVNLAVNAQDPYYAFLSVEKAEAFCKKIDAAVIAGGYYFWHTDMSDNPSDYYRSVLTRVNFPVFNDFHNYNGQPADILIRAQTDPLLEKVFDLRGVREKRDAEISRKLASLPYFNDEINKRPANGMLSFQFREQANEINDRAAQARANGHNGNFNLKHLEANLDDFKKFLEKTRVKKIKVIVVIPPVTEFYRRHISPDLMKTTLERLNDMRGEFDFILLDLIASPDFNADDFQDYDHLNETGAEKLSRHIAGIISK